MATWAIGDIHGCFGTLEALWSRLPFALDADHLWLVGDLVNRGPRSLDVLRWARALDERLGERLTVVLGNHDIHLLARLAGLSPAKRRDTLDDVLAAPDRAELGDWLAHRPLLHRAVLTADDGSRHDVVLVHAGLRPEWSVDEASRLARRAEARLRDPDTRPAVLGRRDDESARILQPLVSVRTLDADGELSSFTGPPDEAPDGCRPWFDFPRRRDGATVFVCGHWAALGLRLEPHLIALDTGVAWGGPLTALRLDDRRVWQQPRVDPS